MAGFLTGITCGKNLDVFSVTSKGKSVMFWAVLCRNRLSLTIASVRKTSQHYTKTLEENLVPFVEPLSGPQWEFQQDNASFHTANNSNSSFDFQNIYVLDYPTCSPDVASNVASNDRQYAYLQKVKRSIAIV